VEFTSSHFNIHGPGIVVSKSYNHHRDNIHINSGMLARPGKSEADSEAEARCYEAEAERKLRPRPYGEARDVA